MSRLRVVMGGGVVVAVLPLAPGWIPDGAGIVASSEAGPGASPPEPPLAAEVG